MSFPISFGQQALAAIATLAASFVLIAAAAGPVTIA